MIAAIDNFAEGLSISFGRVNGKDQSHGMTCGGLMRLLGIVLGMMMAFAQIKSLITREGYSYTENGQVMNYRELFTEYRVGDFENGFNIFFGMVGAKKWQFANPIDNPFYRFRVYDMIDGVFHNSNLKIIECPEEKIDIFFQKA